MRILYITQTFPPEPGSTRRPLKQAVHLQRLGHSVTILTTMPYYPLGRTFRGYRWRLWMREESQGVPVVRIWSLPAANRGIVRRAISQLSFAFFAAFVSTFLRRHDLVIASVPHMATELAGLIAGRLRGIRVLVEMQDLIPDNLVALGIGPGSFVAKMLASYYRRVYRWADGIIVPQKSMVAAMARYGVSPERILLLPHAADLEHLDSDCISRMRRRLGFEAKFVVLYAGSFASQYAVPKLVAAARHMARIDSRVHLVLLGSGPDRQRVEEIVRSENLQNVQVAGPVSPDNVDVFLQTADLFLASHAGVSTPSYLSGCLTTKICEYLMAGRPIVAVEDANVIGDFLREMGIGVAVSSNSPDRLAEHIAFFAANRERAKQCGERARAFAQAHLRRSTVVEEFERQLMSRFPPRAVAM
jgi:colanic acid biosynthesis glycosyl transferase WcaI